jgi:hypothetical protein
VIRAEGADDGVDVFICISAEHLPAVIAKCLRPVSPTGYSVAWLAITMFRNSY